MFCSKCGKENKENTNFYVHCGAPLTASKPAQPQAAHAEKPSSLEESEIRKLKKKIRNAGTTAVALGWFSMVGAPPLLLLLAMIDGYTAEALFSWIIETVFAVGVGWVFVKYGKRFNKEVNAESDKAIKILFWVSFALVVGLPLIGSTPGILVVILVFYLFSAQKALKKLADAGMLRADLTLKG